VVEDIKMSVAHREVNPRDHLQNTSTEIRRLTEISSWQYTVSVSLCN